MGALLCLPLVAVVAVGIWSSVDADPPPADGGGGVRPGPEPIPLPAPVPGPFPGLPDPGGAPGREPGVIVIDDLPFPAEPTGSTAPMPPTTIP
jgi:hypothetical protein